MTVVAISKAEGEVMYCFKNVESIKEIRGFIIVKSKRDLEGRYFFGTTHIPLDKFKVLISTD